MASYSSHRYAGFWIRLLASIIDGIILSGIGYALFGPDVTSIRGGSFTVSFFGFREGLLPFLYCVIFWMWLSATPGKLALGLRIIPADGKKLTLQHAIVRALFYYVSAAVLCLGFIWAAFDPKKQGWHDKVAKTYVVRQ